MSLEIVVGLSDIKAQPTHSPPRCFYRFLISLKSLLIALLLSLAKSLTWDYFKALPKVATASSILPSLACSSPSMTRNCAAVIGLEL